MVNNIRYDRQRRIQNWKQEKLADANVAIFGTGRLAQFTAASLVALGVGKVDIYEHGEVEDSGFLIGKEEDRLDSLEEILHKINPEVQVVCRKGNGGNLPEIANPNLILDLTNSRDLKQMILNYVSDRGISVISASTGMTGGELHLINPGDSVDILDIANYDGQVQGGFISEIIAGMVGEEVRKILMPLDEREKPVKRLFYNLTAEKRFDEYPDFEAQPSQDLHKKKVLIVGGGGLGTPVAIAAAMEGFGEIYILDYDEVEPHNLNRQIMFYDSVGKPKATELAEKVGKINPNIKVSGLVGKLDENTTFFDENRPDLIIDCVDSFATRAMINYFAVHYGIPLVSGGTSASSGQVVVYEPGQSACLDCKIGVERALGIALQGNKCMNEPDPSVIMTNEIIGGMMVGEALKVLDKGYGAPIVRILKYDSTLPIRGGLTGASEKCGCVKGEVKGWIDELRSKYSPERRK